jgi:hypothetical protein
MWTTIFCYFWELIIWMSVMDIFKKSLPPPGAQANRIVAQKTPWLANLHPQLRVGSWSWNKNCGIDHTRETTRQLHKMSSDKTSVPELVVCGLSVIFPISSSNALVCTELNCTEFLLCKSFLTNFLSVIHWPDTVGAFRYRKLFNAP